MAPGCSHPRLRIAPPLWAAEDRPAQVILHVCVVAASILQSSSLCSSVKPYYTWMCVCLPRSLRPCPAGRLRSEGLRVLLSVPGREVKPCYMSFSRECAGCRFTALMSCLKLWDCFSM